MILYLIIIIILEAKMATANSVYNDRYKMDHKNRGFAVIIDNWEFESPEYKPLYGHDVDVRNYIKTLKN